MIYYVEDDTHIRDLTLYALAAQGMDACGFTSAQEFKDACAQTSPDLVLLDLMLPGEDGLSVLSWIRNDSNFKEVPVMILTAKGAEYDKVLGLDSGADDYMQKPFGLMELTSRCKALLRRPTLTHPTPERPSDSVGNGKISISSRDYRAYVGDTPLKLTLKEFLLLRKFVENPGQAFSRSQLLKDIWDISFAGETRTVDTHVQTLRRKLNKAYPGAGDAIETVRGVGYRLSRDA